MSDRYALGVEVGGTFTDMVLILLADGAMTMLKMPSMRDDPSRAMGEGIAVSCASSVPSCSSKPTNGPHSARAT